MGGAASLNPFSVTFSPFFPIIVTVTTLILIASAEDHDSKESGGIPGLEDDNGATTASPPTPSTGSSGHHVRKSVAFKPSTAVIVGVLTTTFSLTFLLLLYIKHCNSGNTFVANNNANLNGDARLQERKNSGIEREVVESLPVFRFGSLRGQKHGLECAVCLNGFEDPEVLRLLPKCKHAFHVECVDTWLDEHSTCPLCRDKVDTDDVVQVEERQNAEEEASSSDVDIERGRVNNISNDNALQPGNVGSSRRVSSAGERESGLLEIVLQAQGEDSSSSTSSFRRSLDSANRKSAEHRLEHRIIVSPSRGVHQRWSDFETSDLLYLTSDKIISDGSSSQRNNNNADRGGRRTVVERNYRNVVDDEMENGFGVGGGSGSGRGVGNMRSVSAMTGMRRILSRGRGREREHGGGGGGGEEQERRREGVVSRWLAWTSRSQSQGDVR